MKNYILSAIAVATVLTSCSTVQSIVQNTFPYTTNVLISSGVPANQEISTVSAATSLAQSVGASNTVVKDIRISSANISTITPSGQSLGNFKSMKVYVSGSNTEELLVASRNDIGDNVGDNVVLDPSTSQVLDRIVKGENMKVRVAYVLKSAATKDINLKISLRFSSVPIN